LIQAFKHSSIQAFKHSSILAFKHSSILAFKHSSILALTMKDKPSYKDQFLAYKSLPKFFALIWNTHKGYTLLNITLRLFKSAIPLAILYVGKEIIDQIIFLIDDPNSDKMYLWTMLGVELGLAVLSDIMNRSIGLVDALLGDLFANKTSVDLIKHAAKLDLYQFEDSNFYDKLERARQQTRGRTVLMTLVLTQLQDMITIVFLGVGLVAFNPWLIVILFVAVIPSFLSESFFNQKTYSLSRNWTPQRRELDYLRFVGASNWTAKEVKTFNLADFLAERFKKVSDEYYDANKSISVMRSVWGSLLAMIGTAAYYGAYLFIIVQTVGGFITVGTLTFLAGSFNRMRNMLQSIMGRFSSIADRAMYLQDLFEFFEMTSVIKSDKDSLPIPEKIVKGFRFDNVGFQYPNSDKWVIKNLSFELKAGEKLALVGENGAGKTTLVKLLARLYEPNEGTIYLDDVDLKKYDLIELRDAIGIIFQDFVRFEMKAGENIAVGKIDQIDDQVQIVDSADKSLANTVIDELPEKYDQMLGKRFDGAVDLSGGQWQKIALARAYMRQAKLLILDEPTSALDARAEHEVFERFSELIEGKMAVLISHRFSTVRMADRILFLENGQLLEIGSHQELIQKGGKYAELFYLQAKGYA